MLRKWSGVLIPCGLILVLQISETVLHQYGISLRTFVQIGKGIFVWTAAPIAAVLGIYHLFADRDHARIYRMLSCLLILLIFGISYARLGIYLNNGECKIEEKTEEGYLICKDYQNHEWKTAWEPTALFFRIPFQGWTEEEMTGRLRDKYGVETSFLGENEDGTFLYTTVSSRTGIPSFYFQVENDYWLTDNFKTQNMKSDAVVFWKTRDRFASLIHYGDSDRLSLSEDVNGLEYASDERRILEVSCSSDEDIPACAADLADWFLYVGEDERYGNQEEEIRTYLDPLTEVRIVGEKTFYIQLDEIYEWLEIFSWEEMKTALSDKLQEQYAFYAPREETASETEQEWTEEELNTALLEQYDGESCEKECAVEDGSIRYRMICVDAALGSRAYALLVSTDNGVSWQVQERDPFDGQMGMGVDFTF